MPKGSDIYLYGEGAEVGHIIRDIAWMVFEFATQPEVSESID